MANSILGAAAPPMLWADGKEHDARVLLLTVARILRARITETRVSKSDEEDLWALNEAHEVAAVGHDIAALLLFAD